MSFLRLLLAVAIMIPVGTAAAADEQLTVEQLVAKHLASVGTPEMLAKAKTRVAEGKSKFEIANGGGSIEGKVTLVSQEGKSRLVCKYPHPDYPGEDMLSDGNKVQVYGRPQRSALASFIYNQSTVLLSEGLLQGTLSTAWPLFDPKLRSAKLTYNGVKTIDGQALHEVHYQPKKRTDIDIKLYFGEDDFRHVLTIATLTLNPRLISNSGPFAREGADVAREGADVANARQQVIRYRIEERFSNFAQFDGMTFPTSFQIRYDLEGQPPEAHQIYTNTFSDVVSNVPLDARNFEIK